MSFDDPFELVAEPSPFSQTTGWQGNLRLLETTKYRIELELTSQVMKLKAPEPIFKKVLSPTLRAEGTRFAEEEVPTMASGSILAQKAKQFDDGLYAAVEIAAQNGAGTFNGKTELLKTLLHAVRQAQIHSSPVLGKLFGAARLGALGIEVPPGLKQIVDQEVKIFLEDEWRSKPISFYTWTPSLTQIWQQDRLLQGEINADPALEQMVRLLHENPDARKTYENYLVLISQLTNPLVMGQEDLRPLLKGMDQGQYQTDADKYVFYPQSRSHEVDLGNRLFGTKPIPEGFQLMDEVIRQIRRGQLRLRPNEHSGWYDYQSWALEPLVIPEQMPEARKLKFNDNYKKHLEALFKGVLALTRETHAKQLAPGMFAGCAWPDADIMIWPDLTVEPLNSFYLRRAIAYRFIRNVLERHFGKDSLKKLHRLTTEGHVKKNLDEELSEVAGLFWGAYATACRDIGLHLQGAVVDEELPLYHGLGISRDDLQTIGSGKGIEKDAKAFQAWAQKRNDPDLIKDSRMMVPVFYDIERGQWKVWTFLGWSEQDVKVDFATTPKVKVWEKGNRGKNVTNKVNIEFRDKNQTLPYPVMNEVYVSRLLNREEFRAHCDKYRTHEAILTHLK